MDPCARQVCFLLRFLAAPAEEQVAFAGDLLPADAAGGAGADDERRYERYWAERGGDPLSLLHRQLWEYLPVFSGLPENTLPPDETILEELLCVLNLMHFFRGPGEGFQRFWTADALRDGPEWRVVRRLSRLALAQLGWPGSLPETTFEAVLYG